MSTNLIKADGSALELTAEGASFLFAAATAFGWQPLELAPLQRAYGWTAGSGCANEADTRRFGEQREVRLTDALERMLEAATAGPADREKKLMVGVATTCSNCRADIRATRLRYMQAFKNPDGLSVVEALRGMLRGRAGETGSVIPLRAH